MPIRLTPGRPAADGIGLRWLGQAGFEIAARGVQLLVDPYLSDSLAVKYAGSHFPHRRMVEAPVAIDEYSQCDWYLCTHGHTDHMDPGTIAGMEQVGAPRYVVPRAERAKAIERGIPTERLVTVDAGDSVDLGNGIQVEAIASAHEQLSVDGDGCQLFLGYVLSLQGVSIYHSGDCVPYDGLVDSLRNRRIDLALLPINGRDAERLSRGVPGNFRPSEAIQLCEDAGIPALIGHHFGMFDFNTVEPEVVAAEFVRAVGDSFRVSWSLPELGAWYEIEIAPPATSIPSDRVGVR